jgi:serine/threonine-protein kinase
MGEVYRAKDKILGRDVAIKVLPAQFASDADRISRFQREAKLLASLNHPNIAAIHGLEESDGSNFLVLELVEGETLAEHLKRGPVAPGESMQLALQIVEALDAAHEKGIIHRDLKPANIKVTPDGKVKVLDFGLAKAFAGEHEDVNLSNSPTLSDAATQQGIILGTAAYMSPEQARAKPVDKRADIWAFGCVLYEMLTGRPAFRGEDVSEILASVIKEAVNLDLLPANIHPRVREILTRCLQKDLKRRYQDAGDLRFDLERILAEPGGSAIRPAAAAENRATPGSKLLWLGAVVLLMVAAGSIVWYLRKPEPPQVMRFDYELPEGQQFSSYTSASLALSADGRQFVYSTPKGLYLRPIDELTAKLIAGTEGMTEQPFFSPDGKWVGYFAGGQLKKIAVTGGTAIALCSAADPYGASWNADATIVYGTIGGIMKISANGGTPEFLLKAETEALADPQILPDGKSLLYTNTSLQPPRIIMQSYDPAEHRELLAGRNARYLSTGHIVYASGSSLFAVPFNPDRKDVTGGAIPLVEGVFGLMYAVSDSGSLIYVPGAADAAEPARTLVWVDRNGKEEPLAAEPKLYRFPKISPDGKKLALTIANGADINIYTWDITSKTLTRLTFEAPANVMPVWTPDSKRIAFFSLRHAGGSLAAVFWKSADGRGKDEQLCLAKLAIFLPSCWSHDGKTLVGSETTDTKKFDIGILSIEGDRKQKTLLRQDYTEAQPQVSPDGGWIAYTSNESRRNEIYVRSFPDVDKAVYQISANGGDSPLWSPDGRELFYMSGDAVMAVAVKTVTGFEILGTPQILFRGKYVASSSSSEGSPWDISPDGRRFLMLKPPGSGGGGMRKINIIVNWFEELKRQVPAK